jgi:hypothetical protein
MTAPEASMLNLAREMLERRKNTGDRGACDLQY